MSKWIGTGNGAANDASVAALVDDDASDTAGALRAAFVPPNALGNRVVVLGDSTDAGSDNNDPLTPAHAASWPTYASILSKQRIFLVRNSGAAGERTDQYAARLATDVTPYRPNVVIFGSARNDINQGVSLAVIQANIVGLVAAVRGIGATPVLRNTTPTNGANRQPTLAYNRWLRMYAASEGITLLDFHSVLTDPATGNYLAAYNSGDNVHPSEAGCAALGSYVATTLSPLLRAWGPPLLVDSADTDNIMKAYNDDGLFLNTAGTSGFSIANPGQVTASYVTGDASIKGNWRKLTFAGSTAQVQMYDNVTGGVAAGHLYAMTGRIQSTLTAGQLQVLLEIDAGATTAYGRAISNLGQPIPDGAFWITVAAPAGAAGFNPQVLVTSGATGSVQIAQWAVYDLTALGLDSLA